MIIPLEEIVRSVTTENPWWESGEIPLRFHEMERRAYFDPFYRLVANWDITRAVILLGPRRVGKTVMTQQLIQRLIEDGMEPKAALYVSIDTPTYTNRSLQFFVDLHSEVCLLNQNVRRYIVFDEIQYLANWERHLKVLVDRYPNIHFVASGSAAAALKLASTESGAGRFTDFMLPPLTFDEYLGFIGRRDLINHEDLYDAFPTSGDIEALNKEFLSYINFGGYPEAVVSPIIRMDAARFIKSDIIEKVLLRDLPQLYGILNIQELNNLFTALAYQTGQEISLETLAQNSGGISKPTISRYLDYLEAAFLIFRVKRVDESAKTFTRERTFKVYLTNASMRAALFSPAHENSEHFGHLVETAIFSQWFHSSFTKQLHYARWSRSGRAKTAYGDHAEIDMVALGRDMKPEWLIEIKWSDTAMNRSNAWSAITEFMVGKKSVRDGVFTSKTVYGRHTIEGKAFTIVPAAIYCYLVGVNTAAQRGLQHMPETLADFETE